MKVKELIKKLQEIDGNLTVALSSDEEGNSYYNCGWGGVEIAYDGKEYAILWPSYPEIEL